MAENGSLAAVGAHWNFTPPAGLASPSALSLRGVLQVVMSALDAGDDRPIIPLGSGDPARFPSFFRPPPEAVEAVVDALRSGRFGNYPPSCGIEEAQRAVAEYLSEGLPYELSADDIVMTSGCKQAIETVIAVLARPGANILLPRPGYPYYEARASLAGLEMRHFDLLPEKNWEIDIDGLKLIADKNSVAIIIINPGNPCGNVYSSDHLAKIAEVAKELGIFVISDEVYAPVTYDTTVFVPMGVFASTVPVLTLGSISKRWVATGWRLGWVAINDPNGIFKHTKLVDCLKNYADISVDAATFMQGALPQIIRNTKEDYYAKNLDKLKQLSSTCYDRVNTIHGLSCPSKPRGGIFIMVKLDLPSFEDIEDDMDFSRKLIKEETVLVIPGCAIGCKNWLRITFAVEPSLLSRGLDKLESFCSRHKKAVK